MYACCFDFVSDKVCFWSVDEYGLILLFYFKSSEFFIYVVFVCVLSFVEYAVGICVEEVLLWYFSELLVHVCSSVCVYECWYDWSVVWFVWAEFGYFFVHVFVLESFDEFVSLLDVVVCFFYGVYDDLLSVSGLCEFAYSCVHHAFVEVVVEWVVCFLSFFVGVCHYLCEWVFLLFVGDGPFDVVYGVSVLYGVLEFCVCPCA